MTPECHNLDLVVKHGDESHDSSNDRIRKKITTLNKQIQK